MEKNNALVSRVCFYNRSIVPVFYEKQCDIVVLEVGMGGKLDLQRTL